MYSTLIESNYVVKALLSMGHRPHIIHGYRETQANILKHIKDSTISHWICSGSATTVVESNSPQIPLDVLKLRGKRFMMICYSMESILYQLGIKVHKRNTCKKEVFRLSIPEGYGVQSPMVARRNHCWYFPYSTVPGLIAQYNGEAMIASYKNALLVQFHPEKTPDGKKFISHWLRTT